MKNQMNISLNMQILKKVKIETLIKDQDHIEILSLRKLINMENMLNQKDLLKHI